MKRLTEMTGVNATGTTTGNAFLYRDTLGRLVLVGSFIDVFQLLEWIDKNPLAQFREMISESPGEADEPFVPSDQFKHLFDSQGRVL